MQTNEGNCKFFFFLTLYYYILKTTCMFMVEVTIKMDTGYTFNTNIWKPSIASYYQFIVNDQPKFSNKMETFNS